MYKKTVLDNGLRVVSLAMPERESVGLGVWVAVGGRYETSRNKGIAHFMEHLAFKGTAKYSCRKIKESLEGVGGSLNGFTSEELTCYLAKVPAKYLDLAADILTDMVFNPLIEAGDVEKERTVILEEIKMYKDLPQHYVQELLDLLLWPGHPLGQSLTGSMETVGSIKPVDIRGFKNKYYLPANVVVAGCGSLEHEAVVRKIQGICAGMSGGAEKIFLKADNQQSAPRLHLFFKETEQTHLAMGFLGVERDHPDRHILGLINVIMGANMSSRLFEEIREKRGLAYAVHTYSKSLNDTGSFMVTAGVDNKNTREAIKLILEELERLKNEPVAQDELDRAKEYYSGQLRLGLEDTLEHMLWIGESTVSLDKIFSLQEILSEIKKINPEDINRVANGIFKGSKVNLAVIGPLAESEKDQIRNSVNQLNHLK